MTDDADKRYPEVIGRHAEALLAQMDEHIADNAYREQLREALTQLTQLKFALDESSIVAVTDSRGRIEYVNDKFCEISKYARHELLGKDHRIINSGYHDKAFMRSLWDTIKAGRVWRGELRNRAKDGSYYWVNTTIVPLTDEHGQPHKYLAVRSEVTKLKHVEEQLQLMMNKVIDIQEEERRRFSRELHDGVGQSLFSLIIQIDQILADGPQERIEQLRRSVSGIIEDVRGLAWELRPSVLDDLGVVPALRTYIDNFARHYGIRVDFDCSLRGRLDIGKETAIYRIVQEALTNIAKYADVAEAAVRVEDAGGEVRVTVRDEGIGFGTGERGKGVGLFSMEERARGAGGRLTVDSAEGGGTTVLLVVPK